MSYIRSMTSPDADTRFMLVFATTRGYLLARARIMEAGIPHEERNTPRELYDQCGMCLVFASSVRPCVEALLPPSDPGLLYLPFTPDTQK